MMINKNRNIKLHENKEFNKDVNKKFRFSNKRRNKLLRS